MPTGYRYVLAINRELYYTAMPLTSCRTGDICKNIQRVCCVAIAADTLRRDCSGYATLQFLNRTWQSWRFVDKCVRTILIRTLKVREATGQ